MGPNMNICLNLKHFKLKNQIPVLNLRKCLAQIHLRQKNPIYNPRIKIQFPIQEYVCLKSLRIYDLAKFLGESAKKIYINKYAHYLKQHFTTKKQTFIQSYEKYFITI
jgi:hypothetical protein